MEMEHKFDRTRLTAVLASFIMMLSAVAVLSLASDSDAEGKESATYCAVNFEFADGSKATYTTVDSDGHTLTKSIPSIYVEKGKTLADAVKGKDDSTAVDFASIVPVDKNDTEGTVHAFLGWYTSVADGTEADASTVIGADTTLYAEFSGEFYVTAMFNGRESAVIVLTEDEDGHYSLAKGDFSKAVMKSDKVILDRAYADADQKTEWQFGDDIVGKNAIADGANSARVYAVGTSLLPDADDDNSIAVIAMLAAGIILLIAAIGIRQPALALSAFILIAFAVLIHLGYFTARF